MADNDIQAQRLQSVKIKGTEDTVFDAMNTPMVKLGDQIVGEVRDKQQAADLFCFLATSQPDLFGPAALRDYIREIDQQSAMLGRILGNLGLDS